MINDEFWYRPTLRPFFKSLFMKHEGEGGGDPPEGGGGGAAPEWHSEFELSEESKKYLSKYDSADKALDSIAGKEKLLRTTLRVPGEAASEDEHNKFKEVIHKYQGVPDKPKEYEVDHPELPQGMSHNADFENKMRQIAVDNHVPKSVFKEFAKAFTEYQINEYKTVMDEAQSCIDAMVSELGQSKANEVLGYENEKGEKVMGTAKRGWMGLSQVLDLDYVDEHNVSQSKIIDELESINPNGCLGNKPVLIKIGQWLWEKHFKEGSTATGKPSETGGKTEVFSDDFYATTDQGEKL